MSLTDRQRSFIEEFRNQWVDDHSRPVAGGMFSLSVPENSAEWSIETRSKYNRDLAEFIASRPEIFSRQATETARQVREKPELGTARFGFLDAVGTFIGEAGSQAQRVNPFSAANFGTVAIIGGVAIVAVAAVATYVATPKS